MTELLTDLADESAELDAMVADLPEAEWARPTPAVGWTIAHQIAHLSWTDHVAYLATTDPDRFIATLTMALGSGPDFVDRAATEGIAPAPALLDRWRSSRSALAGALAVAPAGIRLPWYGVQMSPLAMATGRVMETWAHGQDVADALAVTRVPTNRLRHTVFLAVRTFGFSFETNGRPVPDVPIRVELTAPDGDTWVFGPDGATDVVRGPAVDFCLLATRRRHRDDVDVVATGPAADDWLDVAQTFAGPPGAPRAAQTAPGHNAPDHMATDQTRAAGT